MTVNIDINKSAVAEFCRRHHIRHLSLFGSVLREDFKSDSDVDVLVEFQPDAGVGLIGLAGLELELGQLLGRPVDIHTVKGLNPQFRDEVLNQAEVQYDQTR